MSRSKNVLGELDNSLGQYKRLGSNQPEVIASAMAVLGKISKLGVSFLEFFGSRVLQT